MSQQHGGEVILVITKGCKIFKGKILQKITSKKEKKEERK